MSSFHRALAGAVAITAIAGASLLGVGATSYAESARPVTRAHAPAQTAAPYDAPLLINLSNVNPGYIPARGDVEVVGTVTNRDSVAWTGISLYPILADDGPMTTAAELADAAVTPATDDVGDRIIEVSAAIDNLAPGETKTFRFTVSRAIFDTELAQSGGRVPGVYWFGVHAIGESETTPRDLFTDGRARTFLPLLPTKVRKPLKTAVIVPLRRGVRYEEDGRLAEVEDWDRTLGTDGRMREMVRFGATAGTRPVTWLLDPALPDAVRRLASGNPPRSLTPAPEEPPGTPGPSTEPSDSGEDDLDDDLQQPEATAAAASNADAWLIDLRRALGTNEVLGLPYGDLDIAAAAQNDPGLYESARGMASSVLAEWQVAPKPVVGSPSGYLDASGISLAVDDPAKPAIVLTDRMWEDNPPGVANLDGRSVIVTSAAAASGGPSPGIRLQGVALRQRILSEAALRVIKPGRRAPLVVVLPTNLDAASASAFWSGFDADWLDLTTVSDATARNGRTITTSELNYPPHQEKLEIKDDTFDAIDQLLTQGRTMQTLLSSNESLTSELTRQALASASYASRIAQLATRADVNSSVSWLDRKLAKVTISAPRGVTLSGANGGFVATVSNDLDQPVTVGIAFTSDGDITIEPVKPFELPPRSTTTVPLTARATATQVNNVTLLLTNSDGSLLGSEDDLKIRSAQVSNVIWIIMGIGVVLLFGTIALRLIRQGLRTRGDLVEEEEAAARRAELAGTPDDGAGSARPEVPEDSD